ncbi:hypothetical protein A4R35_19650 [Thermogemmatispora tikiterensis]|uniref:Uncharacterized protein n=1 Tax=Thermogemmatispora tikiterensis TaxID=1825093 RepID=A0A328VRC3_9CHLR|nr:hypothetical protein A4R35_19650 [Thermogemmatispora tikiterensis]
MRLIAALVSLAPQERPASAEEVRRQLASFLRRPGLSQPETTAPVTGVVAPTAPSPTLKRRRLLRLGLGTAVVTAAVGSVPLGRRLWSQLLPGQGDNTPLAVQPIDAIQALAWSPDGTHIVAGQWPIEEGGVAFIWSTDLHETLLTYNGHHGGVLSVAWSPNSSQIASGSSDHSVQVWDASNGSTLLIYQGHRDSVPGVAWSPNGRWIASGGADNLQIWEAPSGHRLRSYPHESEGIRVLAWSPDSQRLIMAGIRIVKLWQVSL